MYNQSSKRHIATRRSIASDINAHAAISVRRNGGDISTRGQRGREGAQWRRWRKW